MSPDDEPTPAAEPRPRAIPLVAAATMAHALFGVRRAEARLTLSHAARLSRAQPGAAVQAGDASREHQELTVAADVGTLLVSVLLFLAGSRVLFRPRGGGWLWRQALVGSVVVGAFAVAVDHALGARRVAASAVALALLCAALAYASRERVRAHLDA